MQSMVKLGDNTTLNGDSFIANYTFMRRRGFDHSKLASPMTTLPKFMGGELTFSGWRPKDRAI